MGREGSILAGGYIGNQDIRIFAPGMDLVKDNPFSVFRPERPHIAELPGRVAGQMPHLFGGHFHYVNFIGWRIFGLDHVGQEFTIRRPHGAFFRDLGSIGDIQHLPVLR